MNRIVSQLPIFITARGYDKNVFMQNKEALKFAYIFIKRLNMFSQTYIISDNEDMIAYAKKLGFEKTIHYPCKTDKDIKYLEYLATYTYSLKTGYYPDWIILLNINQIFRLNSLLVDCINNIDDNYDIITSYTEISDRSHFFVDESINNKEKPNEKHRLSSEHVRVKMGDAAIYAIKTDYAFECMTYEDPADHFWSGKIKFFKNKSIYTDIYCLGDITKYYKIADIINKVKSLED